MTTTRQDCDIYLIGQRDLQPLHRLKQMPITKQVLQRFHHHLSEQTITQCAVRNASHITVDEVMLIWHKAAIPTILKQHVIEKLEKYHSEWLLLKKNKGRVSESQRQRESQFQQKVHSLFDIAHNEAMMVMKIQEDRDFLTDQQGNRKMYMSVEDKKLTQQLLRLNERRFAEERRKEVASVAASENIRCKPLDISFSESSSESDSSDNNFEPRKRVQQFADQKKQSSTVSSSNIFTEHVTSALDRNKTSDREAVRLIVPIAAALGCDPASIPVSRSTIRRRRKEARKEHAEVIKTKFSPNCALVVHWDGKILPEIIGLGNVDRIPVIVSGESVEKLLGVPKLCNSSAENIASVVFDKIKQWNVAENIQAMSFDTTAVNTGHLNGACLQLERMLGRDLLWLPCRHHVMEIMLSKVFTLCFGPSCGPDIPIFKRFKSVWNGIRRDSYHTLDVTDAAEEFRDVTVSQLKEINVKQMCMRDDYKELIELTLVVLGYPVENIHWRMPGPIHHARWMAKLLYAIKMYLFRDQRDTVHLTMKNEKALHRFVQFGSLLYCKWWTKAALAAEAPADDLQMWKDLVKYQIFDAEISVAARKVLSQHLWYLSDELVGLAIFSDTVAVEEKDKIVAGLTVCPSDRRVRGNPATLSSHTSLGDFASTRTANLFVKLNIENSFLATSAADWEEDDTYQRGKRKIKALHVVNDTAERGVKLFEEYNHLITNDEEEKQLLLQVVECNRKLIPTQTTKSAAVAAALN